MLLKIGSKGDAVKALQEGLNFLGFPCGKADGLFGSATQDAVEEFQDSADLFSDGLAGPNTIKALNGRLPEHLKIITADPPSPALAEVPADKRLKFVTVECDKLGSNGYTTMRMREDAASRFIALRKRAVEMGGGVTTAGSVRPLDQGGGKAQSATSLHYPGIAWDLAMGSGMNRITDPYLVENIGGRRWRVWMKVTSVDVPEVTIDATICATVNQRTKLTVHKVTGRYVDFTALAAQHGFRPIRGRSKFFTGGSYAGAEWWHFQCEELLVPGVSTFGGELLKCYSEQHIRANFRGDWNASKGAVWQEDWF